MLLSLAPLPSPLLGSSRGRTSSSHLFLLCRYRQRLIGLTPDVPADVFRALRGETAAASESDLAGGVTGVEEGREADAA